MNSKYRKMLARMEAKEAGKKRRRGEKWFLYILECCDGSLYTGVTKNIENRFKMHNSGKASKYTRTRLPVKLLYQEVCGTRTEALIRECKVKSFPRAKKMLLTHRESSEL